MRRRLLAVRAACDKVEIVAQLEFQIPLVPPRACTLGTFPLAAPAPLA